MSHGRGGWKRDALLSHCSRAAPSHPCSHEADAGHSTTAFSAEAEHLSLTQSQLVEAPHPSPELGGCPAPHSPTEPGTYRQCRRARCERSGGSCGTTATFPPGWHLGCCRSGPPLGSCRGSAGREAHARRCWGGNNRMGAASPLQLTLGSLLVVILMTLPSQPIYPSENSQT